MRSSILSTEPLPNLNRAYAMVIQQERLIGYPEWWGNRPRTSVTGRGGGRKRGSGSSHNKPGIPQANATQASGVEGGRGAGSDSDRKELLSWIIDSGVSHHMIGTFSCLSEVRDIVPCSVGLPNGEETMALKEGTVFLREALILRHVLFVPNLKCNLISVSKLLDDSDLVMQITNKICAIQDRTSRKADWKFPYASKHISYNDVAKTVEENWNQEVDANEQHVQDAKENGEVNHDEEEAPIAEMSAVEGNIVEENENVEEPLGRGQRVKQPSVRLRDYVTNTIKVNPSACSSLQSNSSGTPYP
ncbi:hypothetical protein Pint_34664 [Pistacia integerrima]|uniref:Uncharacterized protein n=1 Tax=Pistacia integerrima TaxID=434235 RepID=A0ACC0X3F9_9ROSI|nr:hypothetical protein Pint_34664 [Pistacia integerrima]